MRARYQQRMRQGARGPSTVGEQPVTGRHILWVSHEQRRCGGDRWPRDLIVNRPHHPDGVCRVCRLSNRRADGCGVPADGRRTPGAGRRAQDQSGRPRREMAACPAWLPRLSVPGRWAVTPASSASAAQSATAIRRQIRRTPQASSPPGAAAMKASWPMASPHGPRPDRLRHEAAWSLPPQGGSEGPQDLHLPQHRIKDSFLPRVLLAFRTRRGAKNLSKMLYKCLVAASTIG